MEKISFRIRTVIENAVSLHLLKAVEKNIELHTEINASVSEEVIGDQLRLGQIINNLISNAVKFTESGEISILVDCIEEENEIALLKFEVKDTGIGIHKEDIHNLFKTFNQADVSTTRRYGGSGLGLTISKELVKMMDGDINVESVYGEGSIFKFDVRLKISKRVLEQKVFEKLGGVTMNTVKESLDKKKPKILLVEDNEINRKIVIAMLKLHNMTCDVAMNGKEAYQAVLKKNYDIVFMDCQMPVMDGYQSTAKIRQLEGYKKQTTIIAMTANAMAGARRKCIDSGMDDYISKPINFDVMFEMIEASTKYLERSTEYFDLIDNNLDTFVSITGLRKEDAKELFIEYMEYLPVILEDVKVFILNNDFGTLSNLSHKLKGSSGNLRINSIYELAVKLEQAAIKQEKMNV